MEKIKFRYLWRALKEQGPLRRFMYNFFVTGNGWGLFSKWAHYNKKGKEKQGYNTKATAEKSAKAMQEKYGYYYSNYYCPRCGKYHLGRNRSSVQKLK